MASKKIQDAQNAWASHPINARNPYRSAQMDMDLWEEYQSKIFTNAKSICDNADNQNRGLNWNQHYKSWEDFIADEANVWPIEKFLKDFNEGIRPQRPFDPQHLEKDMIELSDGIFDHALAGAIDVGIRYDGSSNVWDHWHTVLFAAMCGITHLRVNKYVHETSDLEASRIHECSLYYKRNGRNKKSSSEDIFEKETVTVKNSLTNPTTQLNILFQELLISPSGKNSNYTSLSGVEGIKKARKILSKSLGGVKAADKKLKEILEMTMRCFPGQTIQSTFVRGLVHFVLNFENSSLSPSITANLNLMSLEAMFIDGVSNSKTQSFYTTGLSVNDVSAKNQPAQASSIRIAQAWSEWMFAKKLLKRRPISLKIAKLVYANTLSDFEIAAKFDNSEKTIEVQCPSCDDVFNFKIDSK